MNVIGHAVDHRKWRVFSNLNHKVATFAKFSDKAAVAF